MPSNVLAATRVIQIPGPARERPAAKPDWPAAELLDELLPEPGGISGAEGTLLAVVPIPGTGSSLAIVGYTISTAPRETGSAPVPALEPTSQGLVVDHTRRCAWMSGKQVALTYQEFELLAFLSAHPDQVFSRSDLLAQVWGQLPTSSTRASTRAGTRANTLMGTRGRTRTVDVHVSRLRRKLGPVYGPCLATEYRVGYRFVPVISGAA
jgi:DNA-binding winged helix-turn-helix (wHTH) protein